MITLYGISNCDSVKKARNWLTEQEIDYQFHDFRQQGLPASLLEEWERQLGWQQLLNKRSTTWKQLPETTRQKMDRDLAIETMLAHPTLIKRPVIDTGHNCQVGFSTAGYQALLKQHNL